MDTNQGRFVEEESAEMWMQCIEVGEVIKIKGEECEVVSIGEREITLKLLSAQERMRREAAAGSLLAEIRAQGLMKEKP